MSSSQGDFITKDHLSQEQLRNARKVWMRLASDAPPDTLDDNDVGTLRPVMQELLRARVDGTIDNVKSAAKALKRDYPILEEIQKPSKYTPVSLLDMAKRPRPGWIIRDVLYEKTDAVLFGESGCKKSFLVLDWCAHKAMGMDWQGHEIKTPGKVVYLLAEGADNFMQRVYAWCKHHAVSLDALSKNLFLVPEELPLTNSAEVDEYIASVSEYLCNVAPSIVVFDTLMRCSSGANINAPDAMSAIFSGAHRIRTCLQSALSLIVHHEGKDKTKGSAGSFVLRGNVDIMYQMECDKPSGLITLAAKKMKDKDEPTYYLNTVQVPYGDDIDDCSLVIVSDSKPSKPEQETRFTPAQIKMLSILDIHTSIPYNQWQKKSLDEHSIKKSTFDENRKKLVEAGIVQVYSDGKNQIYRRPLLDGQVAPEQTTMSDEPEDN